jgi:opacity protein-like surface antigen
MKRILGGMVMAAALSGSALAADLPSRTYAKAPATAAPAYNWSGWYGGLNAGWVGGSGSVRNDASIVSTSSAPENAEAMAAGATNTADQSSGFIGGGQFGYNYQFSHLFVAGFEADIQGLSGAHKQLSSVTPLLDNTVTWLRSSRTQRPRAICLTLERCVPVLVFWPFRASCCMQQVAWHMAGSSPTPRSLNP